MIGVEKNSKNDIEKKDILSKISKNLNEINSFISQLKNRNFSNESEREIEKVLFYLSIKYFEVSNIANELQRIIELKELKDNIKKGIEVKLKKKRRKLNIDLEKISEGIVEKIFEFLHSPNTNDNSNIENSETINFQQVFEILNTDDILKFEKVIYLYYKANTIKESILEILKSLRAILYSRLQILPEFRY